MKAIPGILFGIVCWANVSASLCCSGYTVGRGYPKWAIPADFRTSVRKILSLCNGTSGSHKTKLFLVGNSWGGYLALQAAIHHPELLQACILVSPMIDGNESEQLSLQYVTDEAKKRRNEIAMREIDSIKVPFERPMDAWLLRK